MGGGGAERVAATLANSWCQMGHEVCLVPTYSGRGECLYALDPRVRLLYLADLAPKRSAILPLDYFRRVLTLRNFIRSEKADVVVSFLANVNVMVLISAIGLGVRTVICERTDPFIMPVPSALQMLRWLAYPLANLLVVQTQSVAEKYQSLKRPLPKLAVIGNPIPAEFSSHILPQQKRSQNYLLAVGRLSEEKSFDVLIEVFAELAPVHSDWTLRIVGEGPLRSNLENQIQQKALADRIQLPGRTDKVEAEFRLADAFVLTSRFEGFPNALLEAMAVGLPCVAVDCPSGPKEITDEGRTALLVPLGDKNALRLALSNLMGDEALRQKLSQLAHTSVMERYALEKILQKWDLVLRKS